MNPVVHAELAWLASQPLPSRRDRLLVTLAGIAPDLDGLTLLGGQELYTTWHHVLFHGITGAALTTAVCTAFATRRLRTALLAFAAFHLHLLCDLAGSGDRGLGGEGWPIWYLWPFSRATLFWDGQWDLASWQNTLIGLAATLACLSVALLRSRTIVELFSARADAAVVATLRTRFLGEPPRA